MRARLTAILIAAAGVRLVFLWCFGSDPPSNYDALDYNQLAVGLVETGAYSNARGELISLRPPLFPAVAAVIFKLFGAENYLAVSSFHAALSLLTVWLTYRLGTDVYSYRVGLVAAAAAAFYPSLLAYNQFFLSEVLFAFFVTLGAVFTIRVYRTGGLGAAALLGLCLGLGALTRSVLWLFAPLLCLALALVTPMTLARRTALAAVALGVFAGVIAPWAWRNTRVQKTLTFVDVMGGRNVMMGNYEYTPLDRSWATIETQTGDRAWHTVLAAHTENYRQLTQGQRDKAAMRYGINYFFSHPWQSLQRSTVKFFNYWQLEREIVSGLRSGLIAHPPVVVILLVALIVCGAYVTAVFAAIFGALVSPPRDRVNHALLLMWIAFPWAIHTVAFAHSRYHLPFIPIVLVYAAAAYVNHSEILRSRRSWAFGGACVACTLLAASWIREFIVLDMKWFA